MTMSSRSGAMVEVPADGADGAPGGQYSCSTRPRRQAHSAPNGLVSLGNHTREARAHLIV